jgi:competence protein ComEC
MTKRFEIPPLLSITFFLALGIILGYFIENSKIIYFIMPLVVFQLVVFYFRKKIQNFIYIFYITNAFIFISLGFVSIQKYHQKLDKNWLSHTNYIKAKVTNVLKPNDFNNRYELDIFDINNNNQKLKVIFNLDKRKHALLKENAIIFLYAKLIELPDNYDFGYFNYKNYLNKKGVKYQLYVNQIIKVEETQTFYDNLLNFKSDLIYFINQSALNNHAKNIIQALLLGERTHLEDEVKVSFSNTGIIHILAISGLHIGLISTMLLWLLSPLKRHAKTKNFPYIIAILSLWVYAVLVGFSPSVVRAVTMFSFINIGLLIKRESSIINTIAASMFILLIYNPFYIFDVGFQLSYGAVFAIVLFYPIFKKWYYPQNKLVKFFYDILLVSLAAQIGVLPLSLYYFHQLPGLFLIANLVAIPLLTVLLTLGFLFIFLALFAVEWSLLTNLFNTIINYFINYVKFLSGFDQFLWQNVHFSSTNLLISIILVVSLYMYAYSKKMIYLRNSLILILCFQFVFIYNKQQSLSQDQFIVSQKGKDIAVFQLKDKQWHFFANNPKLFLKEKQSLMASQHVKQIEEHPFRNFYVHKNQNTLIINSQNIDINQFQPEIIFISKNTYYNFERFLKNNQLKKVFLSKSHNLSLSKKIENLFNKRKISIYWVNTTINF